MAKRNSDNLRVKRKYLVWLKDAKRLSDASVDKAAAAVDLYETETGGRDFRSFSPERTRRFKERLSRRRNQRTRRELSPGTIDSVLREIRAFHLWLADQSGYRAHLRHADAEYFNPSLKTSRAARESLWKPHPSPGQVVRAMMAMPSSTLIERRNRAIVAFLFLTGCRDGAAVTLRLRHVDLGEKLVRLDGREVATKFSRSFVTWFFPVDPMARLIVEEWIGELVRDQDWGPGDPLFPKTRMGAGPDGGFAPIGVERTPWATAAPMRKIFRDAFASLGMPTFTPHRIRDTLADLANDFCRTPEHYKAWSQNLGHEDVLTTFRNYGSVAHGRQGDLIRGFRDLIDDDDKED